MRGWIACLLSCVVLLCWPGVATCEEPASLEELKKTASESSSGRARADAAAAIAKHHHDPRALVPWLRERLEAESDFHVRLALAYALAAQGEKEGLKVLIDALQQTGHLGYVYLTRVSERDFGGPGVGWNRPAWVTWYEGLDAEAFRKLQSARHVPRRAEDADEAGLSAALAWWKGLGLPHTKKHPLVRVVHGPADERDESESPYHYGFLLREDRQKFTILGPDFGEDTYLRTGGKDDRVAHVVKIDVAKEAATLLPSQDTSRRSRFGRLGGAGPSDPLGVDFYLVPRRHHGFRFVVAAHAAGDAKTAARLWQHLAGNPRGAARHGGWSGLALMKREAAGAAFERWSLETAQSDGTWADALAGFRVWAKRFGDSDEAWTATTLATLERMASEEAGYAAAARGGAGEPAARAKRLVHGLPTVLGRYRADFGGADSARREEPDALDRLVEIGAPAMPALIAALDDNRFTRSVSSRYGHKAYIRPHHRLLLVSDLAFEAICRVANRRFGKDAEDAAGVRAEIEAWWERYQTKGERAVLEEGVLAADASSPAQARLLVARYPETAFAVIEEAFFESKAAIAGELIMTLAPLRTKEVKTFLREQVEDGAIPDRMAAAQALHAQGDPSGVRTILSLWPDEVLVSRSGPGGMDLGREPLRGYVELVFTLQPVEALARMTETLDETPPRLKYHAIEETHAALGHALFYRHGEKPDREVSPEVPKAVEAFLVRLVLDKARREGRVFTAGGQQTNRVGEAAAGMLARVWPDRYTFDGEAGNRERLEQRYAIVNRWRKAHGEKPVAVPEPFRVKPVSASTLRPLLSAWRKAKTTEARKDAAEPILALGLGAVEPLKSARKKIKDDDKRAEFDAMLQQLGRIVREVTLRDGSPAPSDETRAMAEALLGKPVRGADLTNLLRQCTVAPTPGTTGLGFTLQRTDEGTGYVMVLWMNTERVPWQGGAGDFILSGDGRELVDRQFLADADSWWHKSRSGQLDKVLDRPIDQEIRILRDMAEAK